MEEYKNLTDENKKVFKIGIEAYQKGIKDAMAMIQEILGKTVDLYEEKLKELE